MPGFDSVCIGMKTENLTTAPDGWLTPAQLAEHLKISHRHLHNLRLAGMPHILLGSSVRFDLAEVEAFIRSKRRLSAHIERQKERVRLAKQ